MTFVPYLPTRWLIDTPDVAGDPDVFPLLKGQTFIVEKAAEWATTVKRMRSGRELRDSAWSSPRWHFKVKYDFLVEGPNPSEDDLRRLFAFFNKRRGQLGEFFFYDPTDNTVTDQFIGNGNGTNRRFQLTRSFDDFEEPVLGVIGAPTINVSGEPVGYTMDDFGVAVLDVAPGPGLPVTWSGNFSFWCRFNQDKFAASQMVTKLWDSDGLSFVSLKP